MSCRILSTLRVPSWYLGTVSGLAARRFALSRAGAISGRCSLSMSARIVWRMRRRWGREVRMLRRLGEGWQGIGEMSSIEEL